MVNTVTLYRSPVRLVKHASEEVESYSSQAISRARKRLMAEIMLVGDEIIIEDVPYSRNDASTLLDVITEENWKMHSIIYAHKGLLHFLEKEEFNDEELKKADAYLYNEKFVQAVSPYFAYAFNTISGKLLKQDNFEELVKLLNYQGYMQPEHSHEGYQKIRNYLDELNYTLRNLSWEKFIADESILHFIFSDEWKGFLNKLPTAFNTLRDETVEHLTGIVLRFQHKATWHYLHQVLVQLKTIDTNDFNRSEVQRIDEVIYENSRIEGNRGRVSRGDDGEVSTGRIIWWIIWAVLIIVRIATCSNRSSNSSFEFNSEGFRRIENIQSKRMDEKSNEPLLINFLDSLSQQPSLPIVRWYNEMKTGSQPFTSFADDFSQAGSRKVVIRNTTNYNCVVLFIGGPARIGSVYEGALSNTEAVYIQKGDSFAVHVSPGTGSFHFIFGESWGKLKKEAELLIRSEQTVSDPYGRAHRLFVYDFFSNTKPLRQTYLQKGVYVEYPNSATRDSAYNYLNTPAETTSTPTEIRLQESKGRFSVKASGGLVVKEDKNSYREAAESFKEILEQSKQLKEGVQK